MLTPWCMQRLQGAYWLGWQRGHCMAWVHPGCRGSCPSQDTLMARKGPETKMTMQSGRTSDTKVPSRCLRGSMCKLICIRRRLHMTSAYMHVCMPLKCAYASVAVHFTAFTHQQQCGNAWFGNWTPKLYGLCMLNYQYVH